MSHPPACPIPPSVPPGRRTARRPAVLAVVSALALSAAVLAGCQSAAPSTSPGSGTSTSASAGATSAPPSPSLRPDGCIASFDAGTDYYPVKQTLRFAANFTLTYHRSYQVLTVKQPTVGGKPETYVLLHCGAPKPTLSGALAKAQMVTTPVHKLFSASTTHIPSLEALGKLGIVTGVASKSFISSTAARARVAQPGVTEFAPAGTADAEKIVAAKPDVLITGGVDDPGYATVKDAGVPVLADAEFLETDPLGRAEWIKYFAALTGTEAKASTTFEAIAADYAKATQLAKGAAPTDVLLSQPYQGVWSVPAGGSFVGRLVTDARGRWPWSSNRSTGSVNTDLETVLSRSGKAPIWITSSNWTTKAEALKEESRFTSFTAFQSGAVWAPSRQVNAAGGNNYFELGVLRPDLTLQDMVAILHPDLLPGHRFTFFQKLR